MFTDLLRAEVWRKKLEQAGYRIVLEPIDLTPAPLPKHETRGTR